MYYNPLTKEEEFHELVKEIESQSAYKRLPSPEKKYMSVAEMGPLLSMHANVAEKTVELPTNVDAELLAKVLSNPEMAALLTSLAKSMDTK